MFVESTNERTIVGVAFGRRDRTDMLNEAFGGNHGNPPGCGISCIILSAAGECDTREMTEPPLAHRRNVQTVAVFSASTKRLRPGNHKPGTECEIANAER